MKRTLGKSFLTATTSAILLVRFAMPADADVRRFRDANETKSGIDIHWVKVDNSSTSRNRVRTVVQIDHMPITNKLDRLDLFIDTNGADDEPEYRLILVQDYLLLKVDRWTGRGQYVSSRCGGSTIGHPGYSASRTSTNRYAVTIKRACIGTPGRVRVAVRTSAYPGHAHDWAKAVRTFLPWVRR